MPLSSTRALPEMQVAMLLIAVAVALQSMFVDRFCFIRVRSAKFETVWELDTIERICQANAPSSAMPMAAAIRTSAMPSPCSYRVLRRKVFNATPPVSLIKMVPQKGKVSGVKIQESRPSLTTAGILPLVRRHTLAYLILNCGKVLKQHQGNIWLSGTS